MGLMGIVDKYFIKKPAFRRFVTQLFYGDHDKNVQLFNAPLYINSIKENGYLRAYQYADKSSVFKDEVSVLINLSRLIEPGTSFVDAGANVGLFSSTVQRFQKLYGNLHIYAFEANPDTFKRLSKTIAGSSIQAFNYALSDEEKELEFVQGAVSHVFAEKTHANAYHLKNAKTVTVRAKRLDQFEIAGNSIVLKIDVEGHEYPVLEGARKLFASNRVKAVYIDGYRERDAVVSFLKSFGFTLLDGRSLAPADAYNFSLLAIKE
ncbi:MAG TPA: FkbM family methyltransferase [Chitinophagaceae bacterium]|nr:FkbM family methyltransferase [Chitinophagaceae bacterium]